MKRIVNNVSGLSLLEAVIASGILAFAVSGLYALYGHTRNQLAYVNENSYVQAHLIARHEQLRQLAWHNVTSPAYLTGSSFLNDRLVRSTALTSGSNLPRIDEEYIVAYPATLPYTPPATPTPTPYFRVSLTGSNALNGSYTPAGFDHSLLISATTFEPYQLNYVIGIQWTSRGRTHTREISTLVSRSGAPR